MVQTARPIHRDITFSSIQPRSALHAAPGANSTKLEQPIKHGTIIPYIIPALLAGVGVHIVRGNALKEVDVLVGMELRHFVFGRGLGAVDLEMLVEVVVHDEGVGHADAVGFHGVARVVGVVADVAVVEV